MKILKLKFSFNDNDLRHKIEIKAENIGQLKESFLNIINCEDKIAGYTHEEFWDFNVKNIDEEELSFPIVIRNYE